MMIFYIVAGILIAWVILANLEWFLWAAVIGGAGFALMMLIAVNGGFN